MININHGIVIGVFTDKEFIFFKKKIKKYYYKFVDKVLNKYLKYSMELKKKKKRVGNASYIIAKQIKLFVL